MRKYIRTHTHSHMRAYVILLATQTYVHIYIHTVHRYVVPHTCLRQGCAYFAIVSSWMQFNVLCNVSNRSSKEIVRNVFLIACKIAASSAVVDGIIECLLAIFAGLAADWRAYLCCHRQPLPACGNLPQRRYSHLDCRDLHRPSDYGVCGDYHLRGSEFSFIFQR